MTQLAHSFDNAADADSPLDIAPVAGRIGAEVRGVRLAGDLDDLTIEAIKAALVRHKVIFFRGQTHLDDDSHEAFAARLGNPLAHPTVPVAEGSKYLLELNSKEGEAASQWHTDITFLPAFPAASVLRALVIPPTGGDTLWASGVAAYEGLPPALKALVADLRAVHTNAYDYAASRPEASDEQIRRHREIFASTVYETEHPVVHVHPISGEKSLLLGNFVKNIVGLNRDDSARVFQILQDQITRPENVVRWRWQPGDVAIWDNRATQHRAIADFGKQRRHLRRATIAGTIPVALDGSRSRALKPEPVPVAALEAAE
ncbi:MULTISPECIES: TauD/TfdA family dioxygenase [unclassified Sphingomonas]|uniref:TauD/TfdA dioxygenase family protein n=1 Tax=unclassified Sphingomonas TaxID=196159 RepID=UPI00092800A7|nr:MULTISPECIES: TauD/TfdA family dioxygenase [unclassified Sphingomonas]OJU17820.1 MAG: taurine dioxygenase [Sphingomonas sp. 66-10]